MNYNLLLAGCRISKNSFLFIVFIFFGFLLTSCGSSSSSSPGSKKNPFQQESAGFIYDLNSLLGSATSDRANIEEIRIDYSADALRSEFGRSSTKFPQIIIRNNADNVGGISNDVTTGSASLTLPEVIITDKSIKYFALVTVDRTGATDDSTHDFSFSTRPSRPPSVSPRYNRILFDLSVLNDPTTGSISNFLVEYTTSITDAAGGTYVLNSGLTNTFTASHVVGGNLAANTLYNYRFTATRGSLTQINIGNITTEKAPSANPINNNGISFDYSNLGNIDDITSIIIEYGTDQANLDQTADLLNTSGVVAGLTPGTTYYYSITIERNNNPDDQRVFEGNRSTWAEPVVTSTYRSVEFDFSGLAGVNDITIDSQASQQAVDQPSYTSSTSTSTSTSVTTVTDVYAGGYLYYRITISRVGAEEEQVVSGVANIPTTTDPIVTAGFDFAESSSSGVADLLDITDVQVAYGTDENNLDVSIDATMFFTSGRIIPNLALETKYYYRITISRGDAKQEATGDFMTDIDVDGNGLIEIDSLTKLHNMRNDLAGTSYTNENGDSFSTTCPSSGCNGYELDEDLTFNVEGTTPTTWERASDGTITLSLDDNADLYFVVANGGWEPIGTANDPFDATFDGNAKTITGLAILRDDQNLGMFGVIGPKANISDLVLMNNLAADSGSGISNNIGGLVGLQSAGSITNISTSSTTESRVYGAGGDDNVGGLVGLQSDGSITDISATGTVVNGGDDIDNVGGLVGLQSGGSITDSEVISNVDGAAGADNVGGLVGEASGSITDSNAAGVARGAAGNDSVGGLVGEASGSITDSNAIGGASGGDDIDNVGGLVGLQSDGSITESEATGTVVNGATGNDNVGGLVGFQKVGSITDSNATGAVDGSTDNDNVGGLVGLQSAGGSIIASSTDAMADGADGDDSVGGLVGEASGSITASYATGVASGAAGDDSVGGLVGTATARITASYAKGDVDGATDNDNVGGLVGFLKSGGGSITASYATGVADGGVGADNVGGLVGLQSAGGIITASYATGATNAGRTDADATGGDATDGTSDDVGALVGKDSSPDITDSYGFGDSVLQTASPEGDTTGFDGSSTIPLNELDENNAGGSWNNDTDNTLGAWNFGTDTQSPALQYNDYDGTDVINTTFACEGVTTNDPDTIFVPNCDGSLIPGQRQ